jgi:hypothetical protein
MGKSNCLVEAKEGFVNFCILGSYLLRHGKNGHGGVKNKFAYSVLAFGADFNKNGTSVGRLDPGDMQPYEQEAQEMPQGRTMI